MSETSNPSMCLPWRRSSRCVGESHCLEVAVADQIVYLRNSTRPDEQLRLSRSQWRSLLTRIRSPEAPS